MSSRRSHHLVANVAHVAVLPLGKIINQASWLILAQIILGAQILIGLLRRILAKGLAFMGRSSVWLAAKRQNGCAICVTV